MARYQIMYWKDIPSQVKAQDETGVAKVMLSNRFIEAIDAAAMAEGTTATDAYEAGWGWGPAQERAGTAKEVADAVAAELEQRFSKEELIKAIRAHKA